MGWIILVYAIRGVMFMLKIIQYTYNTPCSVSFEQSYGISMQYLHHLWYLH